MVYPASNAIVHLFSQSCMQYAGTINFCKFSVEVANILANYDADKLLY